MTPERFIELCRRRWARTQPRMPEFGGRSWSLSGPHTPAAERRVYADLFREVCGREATEDELRKIDLGPMANGSHEARARDGESPRASFD